MTIRLFGFPALLRSCYHRVHSVVGVALPAMGIRESTVGKSPDMTPRPPNHRMVKIVVTGPWSTEPGHLINSFCGERYFPRPMCNVGFDFSRYSVTIDEEVVCLQVWNMSCLKGYPTALAGYLRRPRAGQQPLSRYACAHGHG